MLMHVYVNELHGFACVYVCVCVSVYVCVHVCMFVCVCVCMYVYVYLYVCNHIRIYDTCTYVHLHTRLEVV